MRGPAPGSGFERVRPTLLPRGQRSLAGEKVSTRIDSDGLRWIQTDSDPVQGPAAGGREGGSWGELVTLRRAPVTYRKVLRSSSHSRPRMLSKTRPPDKTRLRPALQPPGRTEVGQAARSDQREVRSRWRSSRGARSCVQKLHLSEHWVQSKPAPRATPTAPGREESRGGVTGGNLHRLTRINLRPRPLHRHRRP